MSPGALASAGYDPAIARLGLPALQESDAGLGVAKPLKLRRHRTAVGPGHRGQLRSGDRPRRRRDDRQRGAPPRLQRDAGRRRGSGARPAQRPQLRIRGRRPAAGRRDRRQRHRRHPEPACRLHHQALRAQRPGNRPHDDECGYRPRRGARIGPAGLRDRHRHRPPRLGDVLLQPRQQRLCLRERLAAQPGAEARLALSRLRDVGLGRGAQRREVGAGRAGPGIGRRNLRQGGVLRQAAACRRGVRRRCRSRASTTWRGASCAACSRPG